jgi:hypothetical protein
VPSVGKGGCSRRQMLLCGQFGTQQQMIPTAISMGEKHARHHEAPMGSCETSPKTSMAQSMRRTARTVQLGVS